MALSYRSGDIRGAAREVCAQSCRHQRYGLTAAIILPSPRMHCYSENAAVAISLEAIVWHHG